MTEMARFDDRETRRRRLLRRWGHPRAVTTGRYLLRARRAATGELACRLVSGPLGHGQATVLERARVDGPVGPSCDDGGCEHRAPRRVEGVLEPRGCVAGGPIASRVSDRGIRGMAFRLGTAWWAGRPVQRRRQRPDGRAWARAARGRVRARHRRLRLVRGLVHSTVRSTADRWAMGGCGPRRSYWCARHWRCWRRTTTRSIRPAPSC